MSDAHSAAPRARLPIAGIAFTLAALALAALVYSGLGPRPKDRAWWEPSGRLERALADTSLAPLVQETPLALGVFGAAAAGLAVAVFATTRSALARWLAVSAALATLSFVFYALEARFVWSFFRWRWSASLLLVALAAGAAAAAPLLAASWLRLGWRARVATYLPLFLAVLALERNVTGTDQSLRFAISPWPFVQIFGLEVVAACLGALALGVGLGLAAAARGEGGGAASWALGAFFAAGLPAAALALAEYRDLLPFRAGLRVAGLLAALGVFVFALAAALGAARRGERLAGRALAFGVGGALVLAPIALGQVLARLDYVETRERRAQAIIDALARHRAKVDAYPDELAELVASGELQSVPTPRIGFPGLADQHEFVYQNFGESYLLEFSAPRWIQCAYNPPYAEDEEDVEGARDEPAQPPADDRGESDDEGDGLDEGAWSCPSKPPELW